MTDPYQEQEQEIADALQRIERGMGTKEDAAILASALGIKTKPKQRERHHAR